MESPPAPSPSFSLELAVESEAARRPATGIFALEVRARAPEGGWLTAFGPDGAAALRLPVDPRDDGVGRTILVHGHLLPDGAHEIAVALSDDRGVELVRRVLTVHVANETAVGRAVRESLRAHGVPLMFVGPCDAAAYDYADPTLTPWFDRDPGHVARHVDALVADGRATPAEAQALRDFAALGFLILPEPVTPEELAALNAALDDAVASGVEGYEWGSSQRMHDLHLRYPAIHDLWSHPRVLRMLELIYGAPAIPVQSLTYVFGSQQEYHQDTIHLTPFPAGYMCGVWTALEDVRPGSGELVVYPGSHRLPRVYTSTVGGKKVPEAGYDDLSALVLPVLSGFIQDHRLGPLYYRPKAGQVLIWHENLLHGGTPRDDAQASRRSIVGHYFARGAVVYFDSTGLPAALPAGEAA